MFAWKRQLRAVLLLTTLLSGWACSSAEAPTAPAMQPAGEQSNLLLGPVLAPILRSLRLLSCSEQPYARATQTIGPEGGELVVGTHRLEVPAGALSGSVTITAEQVPGDVNSVRFAPEGLRFAKPASLTMSYANCSGLLAPKKIVYVSELLRILELLPSLDRPASKTVTGPVRHFSRYAVAW